MSEESQTRCEKVNENASAKKSPPNTAQSSLKRARTVSNVDKALPPIPGDTKTESAVNGRLLGEETDPRSLLDSSNYETRPSVERRTSSQSARPSTRDMYDAYGYRQKVKLGPRPSTDSVGRPDTMDQTNDFRPVSTLPAGLRMPFRKATPQKTVHIRPQSQQSQRTFPSLQLQRERPSAGPVTPIQIPDRKTAIVSNGLLTPAKTPADARSPKITPEKRRLMKALQLRQKQLAMQKSPNSLGIEDIPSEPEHVKPELDESILSAITDASDPQADPDLVHVSIHDLSKEPSNVEASPISILEISDGPSTQASSVSEEEENTVQNKQGSAPKENPAPSYIDNALPEIIGEDLLRGSPEGNEMVLHQMAGESDQSSKDPAPFNPSIVTQAHQPVHLLYTAEQLGLQEDDQISSPATNVLHITPNSSVTVGKTVPLKDSGKDAEMTVKNGLAENTEKSLPTSSLDDLSATMIDAINVTGKNALRMTEPHGEVVMLERQPSKDTEDASTETADIFVADISNREQATFQSIPVRSLGQSLDQHAGKSAAPILGEDRKAINVANEQYSSSYKPVDRSDPLEVPLPPIDDAEEASLSPYEINHQARPMSQSSNPQTESHPLLSQVERQSQEKDLTAIRPSTFDTFSEQQAERQIRRRGAVNPPKRVSSSEHSDEQFLSDDLFMEELKMATLQEAKPISVSKSPVKPVFSRSDSEQQLAETTKGIRSVSSPVEQLSKDEEAFTLPQLSKPPAPRSFSANQSLRPDSLPTPAPIPKKIGVSSGISQRIKALEQLSSRPTSPQSVAPSNASILVTQRKTSFRSPPRMSDHSGNPNNESRPNSTYHSPSPSPVAVKSNPFNNLNKAGYAPPESISVTATIVRDAKNKTPEMPVDPSEPRAMDLHQSPLVVQHQKMAPPPLPPLKPPRPPFARYSSARSGSSSSTEQRAEAPQNTRRDSFASILSRSSRAGSEAELPRSLSESSLSGIANRAENREEKKDSKRSRLMKRMSSISSVSRKSIANALSPNPKEAPIIEHQEPVVETPSATVDVGDINVQFPDTLVSSSATEVRCGD